MTKKEIRKRLFPMSLAIRSGADLAMTELLGMRVECSRLNNALGCAGFAWQPHFTAYQNGKVRTGGNLSEVVDRLAMIQQ